MEAENIRYRLRNGEVFKNNPNLEVDIVLVFFLKCETEDGKELTRVCMIDFATGLVVYDQLVKPAKPILDYLTK